ncbi:MAG: hypothetical protein AAF936_09820 [Pseudomonadota bacterium]
MGWFFLTIAGLLAVLGGLYWRWRQRIEAEIAEGAAIEWAHFQKTEPEFLKDMTEAQFREVYARVHMPRFPGYAFAAFATFLASLPVAFGLLAAGLWGAEKVGLLPAPVEVADRLLIEDGQMRIFRDTPPEAALYYIEDLAGFYYFFGVLLIWLIIVAFFMRRYHARRPGYLRDEIIRARG